MDHDESTARLRDACEELEAALCSLRTAKGGAAGRAGHIHEVRTSHADRCLRRAEEYLHGAPTALVWFRLGLAVRRAARDLLPLRNAEGMAQREIAHLERGLPRLRRFVDAEAAS